MSIPDCDPPRTKTYRDNDKPKDGPVIIKQGPNFATMWFEQTCKPCETKFKYQEKHLVNGSGSYVYCPNCKERVYHNRIYRIEEK